jgi:hypothetical protein
MSNPDPHARIAQIRELITNRPQDYDESFAVEDLCLVLDQLAQAEAKLEATTARVQALIRPVIDEMRNSHPRHLYGFGDVVLVMPKNKVDEWADALTSAITGEKK